VSGRRFKVVLDGFPAVAMHVKRFNPERGAELAALDGAVRHIYGQDATWTHTIPLAEAPGRSVRGEIIVWKKAQLNKKPIIDCAGHHTVRVTKDSP